MYNIIKFKEVWIWYVATKEYLHLDQFIANPEENTYKRIAMHKTV